MHHVSARLRIPLATLAFVGGSAAFHYWEGWWFLAFLLGTWACCSLCIDEALDRMHRSIELAAKRGGRRADDQQR